MGGGGRAVMGLCVGENGSPITHIIYPTLDSVLWFIWLGWRGVDAVCARGWSVNIVNMGNIWCYWTCYLESFGRFWFVLVWVLVVFCCLLTLFTVR